MTSTRLIRSLLASAFLMPGLLLPGMLRTAAPAAHATNGYTLSVTPNVTQREFTLRFAYPASTKQRWAQIHSDAYTGLFHQTGTFPLEPAGGAKTYVRTFDRFGKQDFTVTVFEGNHATGEKLSNLHGPETQTLEITEQMDVYDLRIGEGVTSAGKHNLTITHPAWPQPRWAVVESNAFDSTLDDMTKLELPRPAGQTSFTRTMEDYGEEDFELRVYEGTLAAGSTAKLLFRKEFELMVRKNQAACTVVAKALPDEYAAEVNINVTRVGIGGGTDLYVRRFWEGNARLYPDVPVPESGSLTVRFDGTVGARFKEPRVYKLKVLVYDDDVVDDNDNEAEATCVNTVDVDMSKLDPNKGDPTPPPPIDPRSTDQTDRARFTWLSGKCIYQAEQNKLTAVSCVLNDTIALLLELTGVAATAIVVYGGFRLLVAQNEEGQKSAKSIITYALLGLVVILLSYVVVQVVFGGGIF